MFRQTPKHRRASQRNWALFIARGFAGNLKHFKKLLPEPEYNRLHNAIDWTIQELERQYPWKDEL
jgi:hypothetical protein